MSVINFKMFPRVFGEVMTAVQAEYDSANLVRPFYEFGTYLELTKVTGLKDLNTPTKKYPLVWLVWEKNESSKTWTTDASYTINPRIFICNNTSSDYSSEERYSKNFEAILQPIWELVQKYMGDSAYINSFTSQNFIDADHLYWGESIGVAKEKNTLFDTLDAIEVNFNGLEIFKNC